MRESYETKLDRMRQEHDESVRDLQRDKARMHGTHQSEVAALRATLRRVQVEVAALRERLHEPDDGAS